MEISPNQFFIGLSGTNGRAQDRFDADTVSAPSRAAQQARRDAFQGKVEDVDLVSLFNALHSGDANLSKNPKLRAFADIANNNPRSALFIDIYA